MFREGNYAYTVDVEKVRPLGESEDRFVARVTHMIHYSEQESQPIDISHFEEHWGGTEDEARDNMRRAVRHWVAMLGILAEVTRGYVTAEPLEKHHLSILRVERRFRMLQLVAWLIWFTGTGIIIFGLAAGVLLAATPSVTSVPTPTNSVGVDFVSALSNVATGLARGFGALLSGLSVMLFADLLEVLISWEASTRLANVLLAQLVRQSQT